MIIIASSSKCGRRYSIQIVVKLEESVKRLHESDEKLYFEVVDYSRRLALENRAIQIIQKYHSSDVVVETIEES